jgi:hypothetical protein
MASMKAFALLLLPLLLMFVSAPVFAAYDANGVPLGASEADIKKGFPSIYCKPLEWKSNASDRRCDDAKTSFGGIDSRITFYLNKGTVQAFDLRFDTKDLDKLAAILKKRYGKPASETKDSIERVGKPPQETYKALWESGKDRAVLIVPMEKKKAQLTVSRGNWEEEIYKVR